MGSHRPYRERRYAFGLQLLALRTRTGLTQSALAAEVGVSRRSVQNWETGDSHPKGETLQRLVALFLQQGVFPPGQEAQEAAQLWEQARHDAPHRFAAFDADWFRHLPAKRGESAPSIPAAADSDASHAPGPAPALARPQAIVDWGEAIAVTTLYGREGELNTLQQWVVGERCRVVALLGLGGVGKSSLAITLAHQVLNQFDVVLFRSLRNGPPLAEVLDQTIRAVSDQQATPPEQPQAKIAALVQLLRERRCLLVLDNFETLMQPGAPTGTYRTGYADYGELLRALCEREHHSCLLLTSREKPAELVPLEGRTAPVQTLSLAGLQEPACQRILETRDITGTADQVRALAQRCGGNPLALQLVAEPIRELFGGDVAAFLALGDTFFNGVGKLLAQHLGRSTPQEQTILYWLALGREPVSLSVLVAQVADTVPQREVLVALESLRRRMLIERASGRPAFTVQPVILEFLTDQVVERVEHELAGGQPTLLQSHALVQASAKDYVRHSQEQLIARPLLERAAAASGNQAALEDRLLGLLASWRGCTRQEQGYGPGNVVNLLRLLRGNLRELDLSRLAIRQAYLAEVDAQDARLVETHLAETVLAEAFHSPGSVALSGDGALAAAGTSTGQVWVWRASDRTVLWVVQGHDSGVWDVALSANGQVIASGGYDGTVKLWEASSGRLLWSVQGHSGAVGGVALSANGQLVASGGEDGAVKLWEASSGRLLWSVQGHSDGVWGVALSADGRLLASGSSNGVVALWDASGGQSLWTAEGYTGGVCWDVALSGNGQVVASAGEDGTVRLWEASSGRLLWSVQGHTGRVGGVALNGNGQLLASGGEDGAVKLWNVSSGRLMATLQGHTGGVWGVVFSADGWLLVSGSFDGTVKLWETSGGRQVWSVQGHTGGIRGVALSADARLVANGSFDGKVKLWEINSGRLLWSVEGHIGAVCWDVALSANGQLVASGSFDGTVKLWQASNGGLLRTLRGHTGGVWDVALSADGRLVASGGEDGMVKLWEASSGRQLWSVQGHIGGAWDVAISANGEVLANGCSDGTMKVWEAGSGRLLWAVQHDTGGVAVVAFSSDGQLLASGSEDGIVKLWDVASAQALWSVQGHTSAVRGVALSADGQVVTSSSFDGAMKLWEGSSGRPIWSVQRHSEGVGVVALSGDGQVIASASFDGTVTLWDAKDGAELRTLRAERRYERMDITGLTGLTAAQRTSLIALGAVDRSLTSQR